MEKKRVSSYRVSPPGTGVKLKKWVKKSDRSNWASDVISTCLKYCNSPNKSNTKAIPVPMIPPAIGRVTILSFKWRGLSRITRSSGGKEANAKAAKVSIMRFTQSIWVTVNGDSVPKKAPIRTIKHAATLIVIWKRMNFCMLRYSERPQSTALVILPNELSIIVMSLASLATDVPSPIESPTCAALSAGASFVPSPVTATTSSCDCNKRTSRSLSIGRARAITFKSGIRSNKVLSSRAANSEPVIILRSPSSGVHNEIWRAISRAVAGVSPVTIFTFIPAFKQSETAAGTSLRTGSAMAVIPKKVNLIWGAKCPAIKHTSSGSTKA